jgi:hypothetical protein
MVVPLYDVALEAPAIVKEPVTKTEPVNVCVLPIAFPNIFDPEL